MDACRLTDIKHIQPTHAREISRHAPDVPEEKFDEALNPGPMPFAQEEAVRATRMELEFSRLKFQGQYIAVEMSKILAKALVSK